MRINKRSILKNKNIIPLFEELETNTEFSYSWRENEIIALQKAMLVQSLKDITDRRKQEMRKDAIDWVFDNSDHPFSAETCAKNSGYDIRSIRRMLRLMIPELRQLH